MTRKQGFLFLLVLLLLMVGEQQMHWPDRFFETPSVRVLPDSALASMLERMGIVLEEDEDAGLDECPTPLEEDAP